MNVLETSEATWIKIYLEGFKIPTNQGMALGSKVADSLETGVDTGDLDIDLVIASLPKFELMDHKFEAVLEIGGMKIPLLSKIDTAKKNLSAFKEYKTGATKWCQANVDKFGQITFYATLIYILKGKIPQDIELVWAPTKKNADGDPELTGEVKRYITKRTMTDILKMKVRMKKAWLRMGELSEENLV